MGEYMIITVKYGRKKTKDFDIEIVPNRFNVDYAAYAKKFNEVLKALEAVKNASTKEEVEKIQSQTTTLDLEHTLEDKYNLIKTIMIANEYEYDRDFWDINVSPETVNDFIYQCAGKDMDADAKKKIVDLILS